MSQSARTEPPLQMCHLIVATLHVEGIKVDARSPSLVIYISKSVALCSFIARQTRPNTRPIRTTTPIAVLWLVECSNSTSYATLRKFPRRT